MLMLLILLSRTAGRSSNRPRKATRRKLRRVMMRRKRLLQRSRRRGKLPRSLEVPRRPAGVAGEDEADVMDEDVVLDEAEGHPARSPLRSVVFSQLYPVQVFSIPSTPILGVLSTYLVRT